MTYPTLNEIDFKNIQFSKAYKNKRGSQQVDITKVDGSKIVFQLCKDFMEPLPTPFALDKVREDSDNAGARRGQAVILNQKDIEEQLAAFDSIVLSTAMKNQKEWFGVKTLMSEDVLRSRYQPLVYKLDSNEDRALFKFKIKCPPSKILTKIHRNNGDGTLDLDVGTVADLEFRGAEVAPILSAFCIWFMPGGKFGASVQAETIIVKPGCKPPPLMEFSTKHSFTVNPTLTSPHAGVKRKDPPPSEADEEDHHVGM